MTKRSHSFGVRTESDWTEGSEYTSRAGGFDIGRGENVEVDPPHRLVQTFTALRSDEVKAFGASRVT